jgi:murein DD-endopeptidase MepM/ murein hydrolase activator NlpD
MFASRRRPSNGGRAAWHRLLLNRAALLVPVVASALLVACGGDSLPPLPTRTPEALPTAVSADTSQPTATVTAAPQLSPSPAPSTATPAPSATPAPAGGISFRPEQLQQGGFAFVYLDEDAANATVTFGGRQYPMLQSGSRWWALIGIGAFAEPGLAPVSVAYTPVGGGAVRTITRSIPIVDVDYEVEHITLDPGTASLLDPVIVQNELARRASIFSGYTLQRLWSGPFRRPAEGALSSLYGVARSYNNAPATDYHKGTDFVGQIGDAVYAAAAGRVVFTGELRVRGNAIMIDHGAGLFTAYHHLSAIEVKEGDIVAAGQRIGAIGSTGLVTGPHLHWEVIIRGVEVNGELFLEGREIAP